MKKRLGIIANLQHPETVPILRDIERWAAAHDWPIVISQRVEPLPWPEYTPSRAAPLEAAIDLMLALGGDGTILGAVRMVAEAGVPVLGINLGTLGFLSAAGAGDAVAALERIETGEYTVEERLMLRVSEAGQTGVCWAGLNDVVLDKGGIARMATFEVRHNGEFVSEIAGDGLIISTPTGSTAYALSVGGPILLPTMRAFTLSPISPHTLAQRPMVFAGDDMLTVTVKAAAGAVMLTVDGQLTRRLDQGATVEVAQASHPGRLITFDDRSFLRVLREKLRWGVSPISPT